ncbi:hypothetical protein [Pedobacter gandavensis]|uniref:hypothetical protein n=1 Tax=Pedobacter gandavensis TaxID=2679963 RepID=UPI00292FEDD1|nr:hypothetical protein [Pedobacter gandavensis]
MNKKLILLSGLSIALLALAFYWFSSSKQINNELNVTVDPSLSAEKVKIQLGMHSGNVDSTDERLIKEGLNKVVFNGISSSHFDTICGENDFFVTYDNQYYTVLRHFIPNDFYDGVPKPHQYNFDFKKVKDGIHLTLKILGPDGEESEIDLAKVAEANQNSGGRRKQ